MNDTTGHYRHVRAHLPESAAIKLVALVGGIAVDGSVLAQHLPEYPQRYRTKRSVKETRLVDGQLVDALECDVPWVPEELILTFGNQRRSVIKVNLAAESDVVLQYRQGRLVLVNRQGDFEVEAELVDRRCEHTGGCLEVLGADRISMLGWEGCSGWLQRKQCMFCDSAARRRSESGPVPTLNDIESLSSHHLHEWADRSAESFFPQVSQAYASVVNAVEPHCHVHVMAGNLPDLDLTWNYHVRLGEVLGRVKPLDSVDSYINLLPPDDPAWLEQARKAGYRNVIFNMEVWGTERYGQVCPEKSQIMPMARFLQRMDQALGVFGHGNVYCGFVLGAQPVEELSQGCRELSARGVSCSITTFTPKRGTPWEKRRRPPVADVAGFSGALAGWMQKAALRPFYCRLSSRSEIIWEILEDA